jgi:hypothetical protein
MNPRRAPAATFVPLARVAAGFRFSDWIKDSFQEKNLYQYEHIKSRLKSLWHT